MNTPGGRRIFGIENEYGITCSTGGQRTLTPDEVARYLFRKVVAWGRSSNVFLTNGSRLYLDVGSHPEYATAECDSLGQVVAHDKAGERIIEGLVVDAQQRLREDGVAGRHLRLQEQHRLGRQLLRLPRELPGHPGRGVRHDLRHAAPVPDQPPDHLRRRQAGRHLQGRDLRREPAGRPHLGGRVVGHHPQPADHQHPRRAARRRRALPPAARHRRRLEHERVDHDAQGRVLRPRAADDRGGRGHARPHPREPDPRHPRDLARHHRPAHRAAGQRPAAERPRPPARVLREGRRVRRPRGLQRPAARAACSTSGTAR